MVANSKHKFIRAVSNFGIIKNCFVGTKLIKRNYFIRINQQIELQVIRTAKRTF
jgi:hypothetical protein